MADREQPPAQKELGTENGAGERKRPVDRRVWIVVGVAALLILGALVAASVLSGNDDDEGGGGEAVPAGTALPGAAEVQELFAGIPQDGPVLGDPDAPVTVAIYSDPQCPACASFAGRTLPDLIERYVRPGDVLLVYRGVPIIGPDSEVGLAATHAAGLQGKWEFSELTYVNQGEENAGWLDVNFIRAAAGSVPELDVERLLEDRDSDAVREQLAEDVSEAQRIGLEGTPSFQVGPTGGRLGDAVLGADLESLSRLIDPLLE